MVKEQFPTINITSLKDEKFNILGSPYSIGVGTNSPFVKFTLLLSNSFGTKCLVSMSGPHFI